MAATLGTVRISRREMARIIYDGAVRNGVSRPMALALAALNARSCRLTATVRDGKVTAE